MLKRATQLILTCFILTLLLLPTSTTAFFFNKPVIRVAIIRQDWDFLDQSPTSKFSTLVHKHCLREWAKQYGYRVIVYEFWDSWNRGDVQRGLLRKRNIDVVIAPGGVGGWHTPLKYRSELRQFVRLGGGFYGICGDSTFGSLGVENLDSRYNSLVSKLLGYPELSPMLGLANVYTDASALRYIIRNPKYFGMLDMVQFLSRLPVSRGIIHFNNDPLNIQEPYEGERARVMLGNAPLVDGPTTNSLFMPKVHTIAIFGRPDEPYDNTIRYKKAIIATTYGLGRVILSPVHAEFTVGNNKVHDVYFRNVLWLAGETIS